MGIFDRAKESVTTRQTPSNEDEAVDHGSQPDDPEVTASPLVTDSTSGTDGPEADREQSADAGA